MNQQRFTEVFNQLTPRRKEVLEKFLAGETDAAIAQSLHIQETTVRKHIEEICRQFALDNDKLPGEHRPKRENLLRLFAKYKPELLSQRDVKDIATEEETALKSSSVERHEGAIAEPPPENELDKLVEKVRSQFRNKIQNQCGTLCLLDDIFDNHWSVSLEQLCINDVKVTDEFDRFDSNQGSQAPVHWQELALKKRRLMVRGKPGAGKTTLLQHIAIQCDQAQFRPELVPIFIRLKFFAEDARDADGLSLLDYISQEYCDDSVSKQEVEYLLRHGRALILLDGLDEVPKQDTDEVLKQLRRFLDKPFNNQIIITCRKAAQEYLDNRFQGFISVEVADFDKEQIETFAIRWFNAFPGNSPIQGEYQANQLLERLSENHKIQELAGIPLLLHLICFVFQETDDFPSKRSELYRDALNMLLIKWNKFKNQNQLNEDNCKLLIKQLSQIAAITFEQEEFYFKLDTIQKKFEESDLVSEDWLKCIEARHGLLVKRGRRTYSFSHQTFQEYLTAEAFVSSDEPKALKKLVNNITDLRWHEVFLLTTEMLPNPNELLEQMKQQVDKMLISEGNESLQQFLKWLYQKPIPCNPRYFQPKPAAVRAFYLARVLNFDIDFHPNDAFLLARSLSKSRYVYEALSEDYYGIFTQMYQLTLERNLADTLKLLRFSVRDLKSEGKLARMLASDMYWKLLDLLEPLKEQLASDEEDLVEWWRYHGQVWMNKLKLMIIEYHNIDHNLQFTDEQKELLKQYYDANQLLMDCLNSDCKVSDEVRSHIEDTLLLQQFSYW